MGKFKSRCVVSKITITGEMLKWGSDRVVDWIWRLCNMAFWSGAVPDDWICAVIIHCIKVKERGLDVRIIEILV